MSGVLQGRTHESGEYSTKLVLKGNVPVVTHRSRNAPLMRVALEPQYNAIVDKCNDSSLAQAAM